MKDSTYTRRNFIKSIGLGTVGLSVPGSIYTKPSDKPNIIIILSDDIGYSDIGCFGGEIKTPNLDRLAQNGLKFTQFYNAARCCPTRASLLSGLYPHQAGVGHMTKDMGIDGYRGDLSKNCVTIAEVLKQAGYNTYMCGKWHVTHNGRQGKPDYNWPCQRGFDHYYGTLQGFGSFYDPSSLQRDNKFITPLNDPEYKPKTYYYTDAINDNAVKYIQKHYKNNKTKPFFMYIAHTAAHWPMHAPEKDIAKYKGVYDKGWDEIRKERYARMLKMKVLKPEWKLSERDPKIPLWKNEKDKKWNIRCMEVYAAMIDNMDHGIGRVIKELEKQKKLDNTLIIYLSDNGGNSEEKRRHEGQMPKDKSRQTPMEKNDLQTATIPKFTRDGRPVRTGRGVMPGPDDTYIEYGREWANTSNTPFRMYKHWVHEGGITTPLIVHWPDGIKGKNEWRHQPGHVIDLMPTCVDAAKAEYPLEYKGNIIQPMEGISLVQAFKNKPIQREMLFWEHTKNCAIRVGKWKLVRKHKEGTDEWELYDIEADRSETKNLIKEMPEQAKKLAALWEKHAKRTKAIPRPDSGKKKKKKKR